MPAMLLTQFRTGERIEGPALWTSVLDGLDARPIGKAKVEGVFSIKGRAAMMVCNGSVRWRLKHFRVATVYCAILVAGCQSLVGAPQFDSAVSVSNVRDKTRILEIIHNISETGIQKDFYLYSYVLGNGSKVNTYDDGIAVQKHPVQDDIIISGVIFSSHNDISKNNSYININKSIECITFDDLRKIFGSKFSIVRYGDYRYGIQSKKLLEEVNNNFYAIKFSAKLQIEARFLHGNCAVFMSLQ
jgi:hypothetical protein